VIVHPIVAAVVVSDVTAAVLLLAAVSTAVRTLLGWNPLEASRGQLALERRVERASLQARAGSAFFLVGSVTAVLGVASVLPGIVPGAMCGTGVLQAMGADGERAVWTRALALLALGAWHVLDRLDRSSPSAPLTTAAARALLVAGPIVLLAVSDSARALLGLDVQAPVDCCAALYDAVRVGRDGAHRWSAGVPWVWLMIGGGATLVAAALSLRRVLGARSRAVPYAVALAVLACVWVPLASRALVGELAAYHYGVLAHDCPWCLFAARHDLVGYPLFGSLAVVAAEALAALLATFVARRIPDVAGAATRRASRALVRVCGATIGFLALALLPALLWRLRHGVWIGG
jgi:hypothetical protein